MISRATTRDLRAVGSLKWTHFEKDVLAAWVAEMDFGLAPAVADSLHEAIDRGDTGYFSVDAERASAAATAGFWTDEIGWPVDTEQVFHAPDVVEGVGRAITHLTRPDSSVILHTPAYFPFYSMLEKVRRPLIEVACAPDAGGRYRLNLEGIDRAFAGGAGSLVLCNPWNPTGRVFGRTEIEEVMAIAASHGGRVISDEIHAPLTYPETAHLPAAAVDPETVVTVTSASKAWNLPGLKCAQVILTNERDAGIWSAYFEHHKIGVSNLGLIGGAAAYSRGRHWLDVVKGRLAENRDLLGSLLSEHLPSVGYSPPEGTYLAWLDFGPTGIERPAEYFLESARVALTDGEPFRGDSAGYARLNFATTPEILSEIVERMASVLEK